MLTACLFNFKIYLDYVLYPFLKSIFLIFLYSSVFAIHTVHPFLDLSQLKQPTQQFRN